ncbi:hypothetical protein ACVWZA_004261 [Sphingomonas sp. UYAg733]
MRSAPPPAWFLPLAIVATPVQAQSACSDDRIPVLRVPRTDAAAMIDGVISPDEWQGALVREVPDAGTIHIRRTARHLHIAVAFAGRQSGFTDLFVSPGCGRTIDLHASAKLGERRVPAATDDWIWWNNDRWVANVSRVDSFAARTFLPTPVREYHIALARFPGTKWRIRVELSTITAEGRPTATSRIPASGEWVLDLDG